MTLGSVMRSRSARVVPACRVCLAHVKYGGAFLSPQRSVATRCVIRALEQSIYVFAIRRRYSVFSPWRPQNMSSDAAKKSRLDEAASSPSIQPRKRKRLINRDVLHKVFGLFYYKGWHTRIREGNDALAQLFVLSPLGHRHVVRLLQSVTSVTLEEYCGTPICRLVAYKDVFASDAFTAELFRMHLLNPQKLTICRPSDDLLPAVPCVGLYEMSVESWSHLGECVAHIATLNATTLKKIHDFPAEYVHLLDSEAFNLDEMSLSGQLPAGAVKELPRTETFDDRCHVVFPTYVHLLNAKKLWFSHGLHESVPDEYVVNTSCPQVEEITIHETAENDPWMDTNWVEQLKHLRRAFPNWRHLDIDIHIYLHYIDLDGSGYDDYFKQAAEDWSDAFEEHLRQDTAPLRIDATMNMCLDDEGHFRAADLPKFKLDVKKEVREVNENQVTETTFTFTRNEDLGEGRVLRMEAWVVQHAHDEAALTTSDEEEDKDGEEPDHDQ